MRTWTLCAAMSPTVKLHCYSVSRNRLLLWFEDDWRFVWIREKNNLYTFVQMRASVCGKLATWFLFEDFFAGNSTFWNIFIIQWECYICFNYHLHFTSLKSWTFTKPDCYNSVRQGMMVHPPHLCAQSQPGSVHCWPATKRLLHPWSYPGLILCLPVVNTVWQMGLEAVCGNCVLDQK